MTTETVIEGGVFYSDGSFRQGLAGWGLHGYLYQQTPLKKGIGVKNTLPGVNGYGDLPQDQSVTVIHYLDAFGHCPDEPTNNVGELTGAVQALDIALQHNIPKLLILTDSEYVRKGLNEWVKTWQANNWLKRDGSEVKNRALWEDLLKKREAYTSVYGKDAFDLIWVKGHNQNVGNELADTNARTGSGRRDPFHLAWSEPEGYHNPKATANPLILKTRMLFNMGGSETSSDPGHYYYMYQLGGQRTQGHKQGDTKMERWRKLDMVLGRRISDATFCVLKTPEEESFLENLKRYHEKAFLKDIVELGAARLDVAYRPGVHHRMMQFEHHSLCPRDDVEALLTPQDELVTKTLTPPRLAREAVATFRVMQQRLVQHLAGDCPPQVHAVDITDKFYERVEKGKKNPVVETKLRSDITSTTLYVDCEAVVDNVTLPIRLLPGVDIPGRNSLARIAGTQPRVTLLVIMEGPLCYSYATVFDTDAGSAIYQAPYTQLVTPQ